MNNKTSHSNLFLKTDDELIRILSHYWGISAEDLNKPFKVIATYKKASKRMLMVENMDISKMSVT